MAADEDTLLYKRARFVTRLPVGRLYSPSHFWIAEHEAGVWRVGFTRFATRMLGEIVEHQFQVETGEPVGSGQIIGWIEGFKAISDIYCVAEGKFAGGNPALTENIELLAKEPYGAGWLYAIEGKPDSRCVDVHGYLGLLDATIDKMLEKHEYSEDA
jgi:glycine cleavage system H protein